MRPFAGTEGAAGRRVALTLRCPAMRRIAGLEGAPGIAPGQNRVVSATRARKGAPGVMLLLLFATG